MQKDLLEEAVRRYPIGTKFKSEFSDNGTIREVKPYRNHTTCEWYWDTHAKGIRSANGLYNAMPNACSNPLIYEDGKWAEIVTSAEDNNNMKLLSTILLLMTILNLYFLIRDIMIKEWTWDLPIGMILVVSSIYVWEKNRTKQ